MEQMVYDSGRELLEQLSAYGNLHIECNQEMGDRLFTTMRELAPPAGTGYVLRTDAGYDRMRVGDYLRFWAELQGKRGQARQTLEQFGLEALSSKKLSRLTIGQRMLVQLARVSLQEADVYFLEEPLLNLDTQSARQVIGWMEERCGQGKRFVTVNATLRHALLMPGTAFYFQEGRYYQVEEEPKTGDDEAAEDIHFLKIAAKSGAATILFEPGEIDYVESLNKCNYLSVRGTLFQVAQTMDDLESTLSRSGFFRCHRSYIVNMQRVKKIERLSKNSFCLILEDKEHSSLPLSKGRVEELRQLYGW